MFLDTEAYVREAVRTPGDSVHTFRLGYATFWLDPLKHYSPSRALFFDSPNTFWSALDAWCNPRETTWLFAHNVGYDATLLGLWSKLLDGWGKLRSFVISDPPTVLTISCQRGELRIVDTLNYWRLPLARLGTSIGTPKLEWPGNESSNADLRRYCQRDVEIIEKATISAIRRAAGSCNWSATAAGLAWNTYRSKYLKSNRRILIHADQEALQLERLAYLGGHCEVHRTGDITDAVYQFDVNSMYPHAMFKASYPARILDKTAQPSLAMVRRASQAGCALAVVRISTRDRAYCVRHQGKLQSAEGTFDTVLCGAELAYAAGAGHVVKAWDMVTYEPDDLFSEYVYDMYSTRQHCKSAGDHAGDYYFKMLLNSLYGKFGQRAPMWIDDKSLRPPGPYCTFLVASSNGQAPVSCRAVAWRTQCMVDRGEWVHSFPAIAAMVTANARQQLWEITSRLPAYSLYYNDCDSLHVSKAGADALYAAGLVGQTRLGALKEVCQATHARYYGPRDYHLGMKRVRSAVSWKAEEVSDGVFLQDQYEGLSSLLATEPAARIRVWPKLIRTTNHAYELRADSEGWIRPLVLERASAPGLPYDKPDLFRSPQSG